MIEKLQKLMAMERSARAIGSMAEAAAFAAKVQTLLFEHNLSMSEVEINTSEKEETVDRERVDYIGGKASQAWLLMLAGAVAESCFCRHLTVSKQNIQIFVGRTTDRQAAAILFSHLALAALDQSGADAKNARLSNPYRGAGSRAVWARERRKSFLVGFAVAIRERLVVDRKQLDATTGGCALVLRKSEAVANWMQTHNTGRHTRARTIRVSGDGYIQGRAAGMAVSTRAQSRLAA